MEIFDEQNFCYETILFEIIFYFILPISWRGQKIQNFNLEI